MGRKTAAAAQKIKQNNITAEYTKPERIFLELFPYRVLKPLYAIPVTDEDGKVWEFKPDFQFIGTNLLVEIQGKYHRTKKQESKTRWRNSQLFAKGYRVLEIDVERLENKYLSETVQMVESFLKGNRLTEHLFS